MTQEKALQILQEYQAWRKYGGPNIDGPDCPDRQEVSEAIDTAITMLKSLTTKPEKEYYGG